MFQYNINICDGGNEFINKNYILKEEIDNISLGQLNAFKNITKILKNNPLNNINHFPFAKIAIEQNEKTDISV